MNVIADNERTCWRHEREEDLPEERQEVEDVVAARRHLRLAIVILVVVCCCNESLHKEDKLI